MLLPRPRPAWTGPRPPRRAVPHARSEHYQRPAPSHPRRCLRLARSGNVHVTAASRPARRFRLEVRRRISARRKKSRVGI